MSDLISRKALIREIEESMENNPHKDGKVAHNHRTEHLHFLDIVRKQSAAYDIDKVVEQLEAREYNFGNVAGVLKGAGIRAEVYAHAIKIVKGGGVDE